MAFLLSRAARNVVAPLARNIKPEEFISARGGGLHGAFEIPNYRRAPFWKYFWAQHFVTRQHVFNVHHSGYIVLCIFFWWTGAFATAPMERREKYYMHSPKFRLQSAYANPGTRPAAKIAQEQADDPGEDSRALEGAGLGPTAPGSEWPLSEGPR